MFLDMGERTTVGMNAKQLHDAVSHAYDVEQWKPVVGYVGLYEVSDLGRVRRCHERKRPSDRGNRILSSIRLIDKSRGGRLSLVRVRLCKKCRPAATPVGRIVLEGFGSRRPSWRHQVRHSDGNRENCALCNLSWDLPRQTRFSRICPEDQQKILDVGRQLRASASGKYRKPGSVAVAARRFGISISHLYRIWQSAGV